MFLWKPLLDINYSFASDKLYLKPFMLFSSMFSLSFLVHCFLKIASLDREIRLKYFILFFSKMHSHFDDLGIGFRCEYWKKYLYQSDADLLGKEEISNFCCLVIRLLWARHFKNIIHHLIWSKQVDFVFWAAFEVWVKKVRRTILLTA